MLKPGGQLGLAKEPLRTQGRRQLRSEQLEGDRTVMAKVVREVDGRHAALAELTLDAVAVREGSP
jgi:hypothetical protein